MTPCGVIRSGVKRAGRGLGPRYLIFAKALPTCYVVNELSSQVHSLSRPSFPGHLSATSRTPPGHLPATSRPARRSASSRTTQGWPPALRARGRAPDRSRPSRRPVCRSYSISSHSLTHSLVLQAGGGVRRSGADPHPGADGGHHPRRVPRRDEHARPRRYSPTGCPLCVLHSSAATQPQVRPHHHPPVGRLCRHLQPRPRLGLLFMYLFIYFTSNRGHDSVCVTRYGEIWGDVGPPTEATTRSACTACTPYRHRHHYSSLSSLLGLRAPRAPRLDAARPALARWHLP